MIAILLCFGVLAGALGVDEARTLSGNNIQNCQVSFLQLLSGSCDASCWVDKVYSPQKCPSMKLGGQFYVESNRQTLTKIDFSPSLCASDPCCQRAMVEDAHKMEIYDKISGTFLKNRSPHLPLPMRMMQQFLVCDAPEVSRNIHTKYVLRERMRP